MRKYETTIIIRPGASEEEIEAILTRARENIEGDQGIIVKLDKWGLRKLAYPIKKEQQGYYAILEYAGSTAAVAEMERLFKIDERVIKFMTIKLAEVYSPEAEAEAAAKKEAAAAARLKRQADSDDFDS
jgi:small subunit ribosomal protein S6